jgi:hypothetical protein
VTNGTFGVYYRDEKNGVLGRFQCDVVVLSAGKSVPVRAKPLEGGHLIEPYDEIPTTPSVYRNLEILIIGNGNSALEFIQSVEDETAAVHLTARTPVKMSWQTHYPGHPRARNLGILDKYQLKSMDTLLAALDVTKMRLWQNPRNNKTYIHYVSGGPKLTKARLYDKLEAEFLQHPDGSDGFIADLERNLGPGASLPPEWREKLIRFPHEFEPHFIVDKVIACLGYQWDRDIFSGYQRETHRFGTPTAMLWNNGQRPSVPDRRMKPPHQTVELPNGLQEADIEPAEDAAGRYPAVASNFESPNIPGLFAAGSLAHYRDFKKSAGGFIHGFRYTARTLVRYLRERYNGVEYPVVRIGPCEKVDACADQLVEYYANRFVNVSSLYQMQSVLGDAIVHVARTDKQYEFAVLEDIPLDMATSVNPRRTNSKLLGDQIALLTLSLEFGKYFQGSGVLHHQSQPDIPSRVAEKMMWSPNADPDSLMLADLTNHAPPRPAHNGRDSYAALGRSPPGDYQADFFPLLDEDGDERNSLVGETAGTIGCPSLAVGQQTLTNSHQPNTQPRHGGDYLSGSGSTMDSATVTEQHTSRRGFQMLHPVFRRWDRSPQRLIAEAKTAFQSAAAADAIPPSCSAELELPASTLDSDTPIPPQHPSFKQLRSFLSRHLQFLVHEHCERPQLIVKP